MRKWEGTFSTLIFISFLTIVFVFLEITLCYIILSEKYKTLDFIRYK